MRKLLATLAIAALIGAACTSGDDDVAVDDAESATTIAESSGTTAAGNADESTTTNAGGDTSATVALEGPSPGVTDDTIKIGITYVDLGTVTAVSTNHGDYEAAYQAIIDDINAKGGINGRSLEPVYFPINPGEEASAEEACIAATEDDPVFAVLGFFLGDTVLCYTELHQTAVIGGNMTDELLARSQAPWYTREIGSDFQGDAIRALADDGQLDGTFAIDASDDDQALMDDTIFPILEELGIEPTEVALNDAPNDDEAAQNAAADAINQRFESAGIETVLAVGNNAVGYANSLQRTSYRPQLLLTDGSGIRAFFQDEESGNDLSILDGAVLAFTFGPQSEEVAEARYQACVTTAIDAGIDYVSPEEWVEGPKPWVSIGAACGFLTLFSAIAIAAGPNLNYATFQNAGDNLGELLLPGNPNPYFYGAPPHADGDQPLYMYDWDPEAVDFIIRRR